MQFHINGANLSVLISFVINILVRCVVLRKRISFRLEKSIAHMFLPLGISSVAFLMLDWKMNIIAFIGILGFSLFYFKSYIKAFVQKIKSFRG